MNDKESELAKFVKSSSFFIKSSPGIFNKGWKDQHFESKAEKEITSQEKKSKGPLSSAKSPSHVIARGRPDIMFGYYNTRPARDKIEFKEKAKERTISELLKAIKLGKGLESLITDLKKNKYLKKEASILSEAYNQIKGSYGGFTDANTKNNFSDWISGWKTTGRLEKNLLEKYQKSENETTLPTPTMP